MIGGILHTMKFLLSLDGGVGRDIQTLYTFHQEEYILFLSEKVCIYPDLLDQELSGKLKRQITLKLTISFVSHSFSSVRLRTPAYNSYSMHTCSK